MKPNRVLPNYNEFPPSLMKISQLVHHLELEENTHTELGVIISLLLP